MKDMAKEEQVTDEIEEEIEEVEEEQEPEKEADPELEAEARKYGWRPKEEYDKNPEGWVDAERFLSMPATTVKMQRDALRELKKELSERDSRLSRVEDMTRLAIERVKEKAEADYKAQLSQLTAAQRAAAENGDLQRYDALERHKQSIKPPQQDMPQEQLPPPAPEVVAYHNSENGKWMDNPHALNFARTEIDNNRSVMLLPPEKQIEWAEKRVKEFFPELFPQQQPKQQQSRVDGGGVAGFKRSGKGVDDLPPEAKKIGQEFVAEGVFKSMEEYAKAYHEEAR